MAADDDGYIRWRCKQCHQKLKVRRSYEGGNVIPCPRCRAMVNVPLGNLEAIARGTDMPETGQPGRLNVTPELLLERLRGDEKAAGPGSVGGPPTLREAPWSPGAAFGRMRELDQLVASLAMIDEDVMGQAQRIYRNQELTAEEREEQFRQAAAGRIADIRKLLSDRLAGLHRQLGTLRGQGSRLPPSQQSHLARLERAYEALQFYGRHVLGVEV